MKYRLGLDLGTTSIGWAIIRLDAADQPCALAKLGTRIFSDGRHPKTGTSLAEERRLARQMRRRRDRLLKRKKRMEAQLVEFGFLPEDIGKRRALTTLDPYMLRAKALDHPLKPEEFGRVILHINQRRGFKSNRKTDKADNDSGALKTAIKSLQNELDNTACRTLGEWLSKRHANGEQVRARLSGTTVKDRAYNFYADRSMIEAEFDAIWQVQKAYNPKIFREEARKKLKDTLLFQRKLLPVKPGRCTLEPNEPRAPLALPSTQRFRIYQEVNNLRIVDHNQREITLTKEQRDVIIDALEKSKDVTFAKIRNKLLKIPSVRFNLEDIKRDRLKGNLTAYTLANTKYLGKAWHDLSLEQQDGIVDNLLTIESEHELINKLTSDFKIDEVSARSTASASLPDGYGSLSRVALKRILPHLTDSVTTYDKAVVKAGYESHSQMEFGAGTGEILEKLPYYGIALQRHVAFEKDTPKNDEERYGKIANPTVHIGLNQIRVVVNALIKRYGLPSEIHIEVTRELKLSREKKNEIARDQKQRQDENERYLNDACVVLQRTPGHLDKSTRRSIIQKMRLWVELNPDDSLDRKCPFSGEQISLHKLLSDEVEIEHILPFSQTLDDSMNNKTVAIREANRLKGNRSPFEAFGDNTYSEHYNYENILQRANKMRNRHKMKRFAENAMEQWRGENDFLARAITDTSYLARIAKRYLACICPHQKIVTVPGRLTSLLRGHYGLNRLLAGSAIKNRDDHRHHAIDAAVIGITDRSLLQRVATASAKTRKQQLSKLIDDMPQPWERFREQVEHQINAVIVSHKPDHGYQAQIHQETAWGITADGKATRINPDTREREIKNMNLIQMTEPGQDHRHGKTDNGESKPYKGYVGGSNYCLEIWTDEKGKWKGDVVSSFEAYSIIQKCGETAGWKTLRGNQTISGRSLVARLMINDCLTIDETNIVYRVAQIKKSGQILMAPVNEANVDGRNRDKNNDFKFTSKTAGSMQKSNSMIITISPIGKKIQK